MTEYFLTPTHAIVINNKVGTNSFCKEIVKTFYPEREELFQGSIWRTLVDQSSDVGGRKKVMLMRDPIKRIYAAANMFNVDINDLSNLTLIDKPYLTPQVEFIDEETKVFKFPEQLSDFCEEVGIAFPETKENVGEYSVPKLSTTTIKKLSEFYSKDISLFNSIGA